MNCGHSLLAKCTPSFLNAAAVDRHTKQCYGATFTKLGLSAAVCLHSSFSFMREHHNSHKVFLACSALRSANPNAAMRLTRVTSIPAHPSQTHRVLQWGCPVRTLSQFGQTANHVMWRQRNNKVHSKAERLGVGRGVGGGGGGGREGRGRHVSSLLPLLSFLSFLPLLSFLLLGEGAEPFAHHDPSPPGLQLWDTKTRCS